MEGLMHQERGHKVGTSASKFNWSVGEIKAHQMDEIDSRRRTFSPKEVVELHD